MTRQAARAHKFNASRKRYGPDLYHSKKEADYAARLDLLKKAADEQECYRLIKESEHPEDADEWPYYEYKDNAEWLRSIAGEAEETE